MMSGGRYLNNNNSQAANNDNDNDNDDEDDVLYDRNSTLVSSTKLTL